MFAAGLTLFIVGVLEWLLYPTVTGGVNIRDYAAYAPMAAFAYVAYALMMIVFGVVGAIMTLSGSLSR